MIGHYDKIREAEILASFEFYIRVITKLPNTHVNYGNIHFLIFKQIERIHVGIFTFT